MVVYLVPLNGEEEVPILAEGALVVAREVGECQRVTFQDPMVVAVEEALGMPLKVWVHID